MLAQLDPPLGQTFRAFSWMRPLRNQTEYPAPDRPVAKADDVREAIPAARAMVDIAGRVIEEMPAY